jgi:hypothetical protein
MARSRFIWTESDLKVVCRNYYSYNWMTRQQLIKMIRKDLDYLNDSRLSGCRLPTNNAIEMKIRACDHLDFTKKCSSKQFPSQLHMYVWDQYLSSQSARFADSL